MKSIALQGLKVLDFSWVIAGPLTTKYLADYGATVLKLESPKRPDVERTSPPFRDGITGVNRSAYYVNWNTNKLSMTLDVKHPEGRKIAIELIKWCDILVENFTPGVMTSWGLNYESVRKIKPDIIMYSVSSYGQAGPYANLPGYGFHTSSLAGVVHYTGWPDAHFPQRVGAYCDVITPYFGVAALMTALSRKRKTGQGCYIDLSQYESGITFLTSGLLDYQLNGNPGGRRGNRDAQAAPHGVYRCQGDERWCAIAVFNDREWQALCRASGNPGWLEDSRFATLEDRKRNEGALDELIGGWTLTHTAEEAFALLNRVGVRCGVVQNSSDLVKDPQLEHREFYWLQDHKEVGRFHALGQGAIMSKTPAAPYLPAPCLGEHTEQVCREILHIPDARFIELLGEGVFE